MREADCFVACAPRNEESTSHLPATDRDLLMTRIAVGGFLHETNSFAPTKATYADFGLRLKPNGPAFVPPVRSRSHSPAIG